MNEELNLIKKAEEVLKRPYAGIQSIANAWEMLLNRGREIDGNRHKRINGKREFIEGLNLPIYYEDGSPVGPDTGVTPVEDILNRQSICVSVQTVKEHAIEANHPWPLLSSNPIDKNPASELSLPTEPLLVSKPVDKKLVKKFTRSTIAVLVESIRKKSDLPNDLNAIWAELMALAKSKESPAPLVGFAPSEGIQYRGAKFDDSEELDIYTKEALRAYLSRHKIS